MKIECLKMAYVPDSVAELLLEGEVGHDCAITASWTKTFYCSFCKNTSLLHKVCPGKCLFKKAHTVG